MTQTNSHMPVISGATLKTTQQQGVKIRRLRRQVARTTEETETEELMTRSLDRAQPRGIGGAGPESRDDAGRIVKRDSWGVGDRIRRMSADILGRRNKTTRWRDHLRPRSVEIPADRSLSNGTSGYSTEERSTEVGNINNIQYGSKFPFDNDVIFCIDVHSLDFKNLKRQIYSNSFDGG